MLAPLAIDPRFVYQPGCLSPTASVELEGWTVQLKLEGFTPSASHKHRSVVAVIQGLRRRGELQSHSRTELVISSSGNAAYALALQTVGTNAHVTVFTDTLSPTEFSERLASFSHVDTCVVNSPDATGSHAAARKQAVLDFKRANPLAIEIDQYAHSEWGCGYTGLFEEIERQVSRVAAVFIPVGTGATIRAAVRYKLRHRRTWAIYAVDALGSALNGCPVGRRVFSGYGNGSLTQWVAEALPHLRSWIRVPDRATVKAADWLWARGYFLGASSCACLAAAAHTATTQQLPHDGATVLLMPDRGETYRSTLYAPDFRSANSIQPR